MNVRWDYSIIYYKKPNFQKFYYLSRVLYQYYWNIEKNLILKNAIKRKLKNKCNLLYYNTHFKLKNFSTIYFYLYIDCLEEKIIANIIILLFDVLIIFRQFFLGNYIYYILYTANLKVYFFNKSSIFFSS